MCKVLPLDERDEVVDALCRHLLFETCIQRGENVAWEASILYNSLYEKAA